MSKTYGLNKKNMGRVNTTVLRVESQAYGNRSRRRSHKGAGGAGGASLYWAKAKTITDENNVIADIYYSRVNADPDIENAKVRIWDIVSLIQVDTWFMVQPATGFEEMTYAEGEEPPPEDPPVAAFDYEGIPQIGAI